MSLLEQETLYQNTMDKYNLYAKRSILSRHGKCLTQGQVDYILNNKDTKKYIEIAEELGITANRVGNVILGKSYNDLIKIIMPDTPKTAVNKFRN